MGMDAILWLEDGTQWPGRMLGNSNNGFGEAVFTTSMSGYQELLTDPSYCGQILVFTTAHVGNVGINQEDFESTQVWPSAMVTQDVPRLPSNWRSNQSLPDWFPVPLLTDVDTRALVRHLRSQGAMRAVVTSDPSPETWAALQASPTMEGQNLIAKVTCKERTTSPALAKGDAGGANLGECQESVSVNRKKVVAFDFGMKSQMVKLLNQAGLEVIRVPSTTTAAEVFELKPDGVFLSNGPGDPAALGDIVEQVQQMLGKIPIFGICLGHQLLGRAVGADTFKLKFGHRGSNQPVKDVTTGRVEITSQNHGFAVDPKTLPPEAQVTHINLNDQTCEGLAIPEKFAFSVQYHPENAPGPHDSRYLFDRFIQIMEAFHAKTL
jgi:carbamoyl-phosphate synthase small subunit